MQRALQKGTGCAMETAELEIREDRHVDALPLRRERGAVGRDLEFGAPVRQARLGRDAQHGRGGSATSAKAPTAQPFLAAVSAGGLQICSAPT